MEPGLGHGRRLGEREPADVLAQPAAGRGWPEAESRNRRSRCTWPSPPPWTSTWTTSAERGTASKPVSSCVSPEDRLQRLLARAEVAAWLEPKAEALVAVQHDALGADDEPGDGDVHRIGEAIEGIGQPLELGAKPLQGGGSRASTGRRLRLTGRQPLDDD